MEFLFLHAFVSVHPSCLYVTCNMYIVTTIMQANSVMSLTIDDTVKTLNTLGKVWPAM